MSEYITSCEPYILNETNMQHYLKYTLNNLHVYNPTPKLDTTQTNDSNITITKSSVSSIFYPKEQDSLFWCYYIISNGDISYEMLQNRNTLTTKQLKIEYISKIRENKSVVKMYKFDTISNIENNLANDAIINIKTAMTLFAIQNMNVIFVNNKTYFELLTNDTNIVYIIKAIEHKSSNYVKKYGYEIGTEDTLNNIRNTLYKITTLDKPIKSLSSYKVADLLDIATKLAIPVVNNETGKHKTKNDLYESIVQYF
jgi:hypothetical protein